MNNYILKRCIKCGALVRVIKNCECRDCGILCCGESMHDVNTNEIDGIKEKHLPSYEIMDNNLHITINHVMDDDHYIEWISIISESQETNFYFKPGDELSIVYPYSPNLKIYSYCNKHGLWKVDVK